MGLLSVFFGRKAQKDYFPPPPATVPPVPTEHWQLIVDAAGEVVTDRPPAPTDFLARYPADYIDGGTIPGYTADKNAGRAENLRRLVQAETRAARNKELLKKAVFLLSQTDDGYRLLALSKRENFKIVFDSDTANERGVAGLCDYKNKQIPLLEGRTAEEVALTLKHELQHMEDIKNGFGGSYGQTMREYVTGDRALESNARVSEAVAAAELLLGSRHGPERQFRSASLFSTYWDKLPRMGEKAREGLADAAEGNWQGFAAKVFPAYYEEKATLAFYEKDYLNGLSKLVPDVEDDLKKADTASWEHREIHRRRINAATANAKTLFTGGTQTVETIAAALSVKGQKYLQSMKAHFDFGGDAATAFSKEGLALVEKLKTAIDRVLPENDKAKGMALPEEKTKDKMRVMPPAANPYKKHVPPPPGEEQAFQPFRMPYRIDGNRQSNGKRSHENTTEIMAGHLQRASRSGATQMDKVNFAVMDYMQGNHANNRGKMSALVEAGFLAPIGALPDRYLFDLWGRMQSSADGGHTGENSGISPQEMKLLQHWQQMAEKGMDPLWLDKENRQKSQVSTFREIGFYGDMIARSLAKTPVPPPNAAPRQKPAAR
jgi:hypothetical protein